MACARRFACILLPLGLGCAACNARPDSSAVAQLTSSPESQASTPWQGAPPGADQGASPDALVAAMAKRLTRGMLADGAAVHGQLHQGQHQDQLLVLRGGDCYRVLGAGSAGIADLDLFLYDPNGVQVQQDPAEDRFPTLGVLSDLCPPRSGAYRLQVSMYKGAGAYALRVYRTP
jgi:hypothetical protein